MSDIAVSKPQSALRRLASLLAQSFLAQWVLFVVPALYLASNWFLLHGVEGVARAPVSGLLFELMTFGVPLGLVTMLVLRLVQYAVIESRKVRAALCSPTCVSLLAGLRASSSAFLFLRR